MIFDHSWYGRMLKSAWRTIPEKAWRAAYRDIVEFERMLADDGTAILKFFLHISKKEQKKRFRSTRGGSPGSLARHGKTIGRGTRNTIEYLIAIEEMLELTESEYAPWTIVEATSGRMRERENLRDDHCGVWRSGSEPCSPARPIGGIGVK